MRAVCDEESVLVSFADIAFTSYCPSLVDPVEFWVSDNPLNHQFFVDFIMVIICLLDSHVFVVLH